MVGTPFGSDWLTLDKNHVWHPYTSTLGAAAPVPIVHAEGVYLHTADGRRILDGISSWWVNIHGHNHPFLNQALKAQIDRFAHTIFAGFTHEPGAKLAASLAQRTRNHLPHVFYTDNGSTAVEAALKMAYQYWRHQGQTQRTSFVAIADAYHGDTFGAMAVGDVAVFHRHFADVLFRVHHARGPELLSTKSHSTATLMPTLDEILSRHGHHIAAVIIEPMLQGAGGMKIWPASYLRHIREITQTYNIPLIADEVFTGFGRTGHFFACEHADVQPDIMCLSKAITGGYLPLAATLASDTIFDAFRSDDPARTFFHGHSYTGNALACAVACASLELFESENRLARVQQLERLFVQRLAHIATLPLVATTRAIGGLAVIELKETRGGGGYLDQIGRRVTEALLQHDIFLRPLGNVLYFLPPYVITDTEAHRVFDVIEEILRTHSV